jgi:nucleotide-binding universal stress UspA family protein
VVLIVLGVAAAAVVLAVEIPALLGEAFLTLGRRHRYWPLLHLGVALYAALGLSDILARAASVRRRLAAGVAAVVVALAVPSPVVASLALPEELGHASILDQALSGNSSNLLNAMAPEPGQRCIVAVPVGTSVRVFSYTGYRLVSFVWNREYFANRARIRWRDIYEIIPGDLQRLADNRRLTDGLASPQEWRGLAARWGVDLVVAPASRAGGLAFRGMASEPVEGPFLLFRLGDCQH